MVGWYGTRQQHRCSAASIPTPATAARATRTATSTKSSLLSAALSSLATPVTAASNSLTNSMSSCASTWRWRCHQLNDDERCHRVIQLMRFICAIMATIIIADVPCTIAVAPLAWTYLKGPSPITSGRAAVVGALGVEVPPIALTNCTPPPPLIVDCMHHQHYIGLDLLSWCNGWLWCCRS